MKAPMSRTDSPLLHLHPNDNADPYSHNTRANTHSHTSDNQNFWLDANTYYQSSLDVRS